MISKRQEVSKVTMVWRQRATLPCKNSSDIWDWCPSNQTRHSHYGWVWVYKPQTLTPRAGAQWGSFTQPHCRCLSPKPGTWTGGASLWTTRRQHPRWKEGVLILPVLLFLMCNLLTKNVVWAAYSYLRNSMLILVTFQRKKGNSGLTFPFNTYIFSLETAKVSIFFLVTKGEPEKKTKSKHSPAGKHIFKTLLCPERGNSISCFWCGKSGKISSLHPLTPAAGEGQGISWGFCRKKHWGFEKCILLLGVHWCLSKVTCLSKTRKSICSPAYKLLLWLVLFNCDLFWLLCLHPNFISCVCFPSLLPDITQIPCSPEMLLFLSLL